ncbi:TIGR04283 family arsenosugar biosynthesis glycosyltransferase [Wocania ichthyoenteri]|uniref:TIGR04283 family arsenosugar biosynthesis glycosyltransferase n=1 Tax=Wocania ichthyoenteri TaxID=1230531 RepID=UPI00053DB87A|nr:TIGR04283 family arsenosugar biosynthesis glycosyltransferase [Wocania ichthyoenteri]
MKHQISIIIPTLNEADNIPNLLNHLIKNSSKENIADIIIVDGGSTDGSQNIVQNFVTSSNSEYSEELYREVHTQVLDTKFSIENSTRTGIKLVNSTKGRAKQMNLGAKNATGNILYFLHADSFPPKNFDKHIIDQIKKNNHAGCFRMKFNSSHLWLKLAGQLTCLPFKSCRGGDQSLFITKSLFNCIEGFDENFKIYEDNDLISKLYARKQFVVIQKWLTTSPRHYNTNGVWSLQYHYWAIHLKKWLGASPDKLNQYYAKYISVNK